MIKILATTKKAADNVMGKVSAEERPKVQEKVKEVKKQKKNIKN